MLYCMFSMPMGRKFQGEAEGCKGAVLSLMWDKEA